MQDLDKRRAKRILLTQLLLTLSASLAGATVALAWGISVLLGGAIALAANALFAVAVFGRYRASEPRRMVGRFFGAELGKLVFVALAFAAAFFWVELINPIVLLISFFVVQVLPALIVGRVAG